MDLISYGSVSKDFVVMAQMSKLLKSIKSGKLKSHRLDCYSTKTLGSKATLSICSKFVDVGLPIPENIEVFYPSVNYPSHVDEGGISYFIGLESGQFLIEGVYYTIVPFVLYSFEDSKLHNTNFASIMMKL